MHQPPEKQLIGMIHVRALPGTPRCVGRLSDVIATAANEARLLARHGFDALLIENMHDAPYLRGRVGPEIVAAMTAVGLAVRKAVETPLGVQVLAGANRAAAAVALACGATFIRVENFCYAQVADEGLMPEAQAGPLLRYRRRIGAEHVRVMADVKKKHAAHAITADVGLAETVRTAEFMGADGVIVSGEATGRSANPEDVRAARSATDLPVWVGSGVTAENLRDYWTSADGLIIGSYLKRDGCWSAPLDEQRVAKLMEAATALRAGRVERRTGART